jgi:hypothetical protein
MNTAGEVMVAHRRSARQYLAEPDGRWPVRTM